jgi:hypothetical protein
VSAGMIEMKLLDILERHVREWRKIGVRNVNILNAKSWFDGGGFGRH